MFYCPSLRFRGNSSWPYDIDSGSYALRFSLLSGPGTWGGLPVIDYSGNPFYRLAVNPDLRGGYTFGGFEVIGGEWFAMWQSSQWNGLGSAERIVSFLVLSLILLHMKEEELQF